MRVPVYKYEKELKDLSLSISCPDSNSKQMNYESVFRFVANEMPTQEDFIPQSVKRIQDGRKPPQRRIDENDERWFCEEWALSLYTSLKNVREFVQNAPVHWKRKNKWFFIAEGPIQTSDGLCTAPDKFTHFNLFEFKGVDLRKKFTVVEST